MQKDSIGRITRWKLEQLNSAAGTVGIVNGIILGGSAGGVILSASLLNTCLGVALSLNAAQYHDAGALMKATYAVMSTFIMGAAASLLAIYFRHSRLKLSAAYLNRILFENENGGRVEIADTDVMHDKGASWLERGLTGFSGLIFVAGLGSAFYAYGVFMTAFLNVK